MYNIFLITMVEAVLIGENVKLNFWYTSWLKIIFLSYLRKTKSSREKEVNDIEKTSITCQKFGKDNI